MEGVSIASRPKTIRSDDPLADLEQVLGVVPQHDVAGSLVYLLTSGVSVELLTRFRRPHHDLDVVVMDPEDLELAAWDLWDIHTITPNEYWAAMRFEPGFMADTREVAHTRGDNEGLPVDCVHPAITLIQKLSDYHGLDPRPKDIEDSQALADYLRRQSINDWKWIADTALDALPLTQVNKTLERFRPIMASIQHYVAARSRVAKIALGTRLG